MPSYVIPDKCDGCKALDKTACQYICPNDLMVLDKEKMKAYNRESRTVLGMLQLRQDLPDAGGGSSRLCGLRSPRRFRDATALHGLDHVDREIPEWNAETVQVPHPHHARRHCRTRRRVQDSRAISRAPRCIPSRKPWDCLRSSA